MTIHFEWDDEKNKTNIAVHSLSFDVAKEIFSHPIVINYDSKHSRAEDRYTAFGHTRGRVLRVTYTIRGHVIRLISAGRAVKREEKAYYKKTLG